MRLRQIRTHKLFGLFNHVISLNMDDRITIIHGPNGFGKTAILRMIAGIFESSYSVLRSLPFERLELEFDNDKSLIVTKRSGNLKGEGAASIVFDYPGGESYQLNRNRITSRDVPSSVLGDLIPGLERVAEAEWILHSTGELLGFEEIFERFGDEIQLHIPVRLREHRPPGWFVELRNSLDVHLIRANRLERPESNYDRRGMRRLSSTPVVARYATELAEHIQATLARYAELSQSLDRSFPRRLVTSARSPGRSMDEIRNRLGELETRRSRLTEAGLLDKEEQSPFEVLPQIDESKADVLSVYIDDVEQKLSVFDALFSKIDLFKTIINRRFLFKSVLIDKNQGIVFLTADGNRLPPAGLSSGEQHEVVLLYELLFKVGPNVLMLIDEPELSLHIAWQEQFLNDLSQITSLSEFDVLIATHSPQIISDRWDLTVELKGPGGCASTSPQTTSRTRSA